MARRRIWVTSCFLWLLQLKSCRCLHMGMLWSLTWRWMRSVSLWLLWLLLGCCFTQKGRGQWHPESGQVCTFNQHPSHCLKKDDKPSHGIRPNGESTIASCAKQYANEGNTPFLIGHLENVCLTRSWKQALHFQSTVLLLCANSVWCE